jgi:IclR family acetate operon transcriptional repressor
MRDNDRHLVKSVSRTLAILEVLGHGDRSQALAEIAASAGLPKSTVHRLLATLAHEGYVRQDETTNQYSLSAKVLDLASSYLASLDLRDVARPILTELWQRSNETVHMALLDEGEVMYIEKLESAQTIRMSSQVGRRAPAHCTSLGKAMLAFLPPPELDRVLERHGLRRYTENTIVERAALESELAAIRLRGAAFDNEEHEPLVRCVAAPIRGSTGAVVGAASVSAPAFRMTPERQREIEPWVKAATQEISRRLGYVPAPTEEQANGSAAVP